ncbi:hypothetical protein ACSAZK_12930 [Methanosarcina sp. Mfa9]|uniref:hypothetical protein n=1 Tax=Methanosarcina sp. Mfa9 TaxID=3439063 RepID=UPI003F8381A4
MLELTRTTGNNFFIIFFRQPTAHHQISKSKNGTLKIISTFLKDAAVDTHFSVEQRKDGTYPNNRNNCFIIFFRQPTAHPQIGRSMNGALKSISTFRKDAAVETHFPVEQRKFGTYPSNRNNCFVILFRQPTAHHQISKSKNGTLKSITPLRKLNAVKIHFSVEQRKAGT